MIGLKNGVVELAPHDPGWKAQYEREAARLRDIVGGDLHEIAHVGSTSVEGLAAKPIIDITVALRSYDRVTAVAGRLAGSGYLDMGDQKENGGYLIAKEGPAGVRTFHIHLVPRDSGLWRDYLAFRDALRRDSAVRRRYEVLKRELADRYCNDRVKYTESKNDFIRNVIKPAASGS